MKKFYLRMVYKLKFRIFRWILKEKESFKLKLYPVPPINENQKLALGIIEEVMMIPESDLLIAPLSGTRYIKLKDVFLKMENSQSEGTFVQIINGRFSHYIGMPERIFIDRVEKTFDMEVEKRRKVMEKEMFSKMNKSLGSILEEMKKKNTNT